MTLNTLSNHKMLLTCLSMACVFLAALSQPANAASPKYKYPACLYFYENAGKQKLKSERSCFTRGGHGEKVMGGEDKNFKKLKKLVKAFGKPVQYVGVKKDHTVELHYKKTNGKMDKIVMTRSGPVDIRRGALKGVRTWKTSDKHKGYPLCLYESKASLKKKKMKHAICLRFGEYRNLEAFGWDNKAKYIDLRKGYKAYLFKDENFEGIRTIMETDGRIRLEGKNKSVTSIRIEKK